MIRLLQWGIVLWTGIIFAQDTVTLFGNFLTPERTPIEGVHLQIVGTTFETVSAASGVFRLVFPAAEKTQTLVVTHPEFQLQRISIEVGQRNIHLKNHLLFRAALGLQTEMDIASNAAFFEGAQPVAFGTLLHARRRPFLNAVAFHFSPLFFKPQGFTSSQQEVLINGLPNTDYENGNPLWSAWGGINDFTNAGQQNFYGISEKSSVFGGLLGTTEFRLLPSELREGTKISSAFSNATYTNRFMVSHLNNSGGIFNYGLLFSYRYGKEGYQQGSNFTSYSIAAVVEAFLSQKLNTNLLFIYTPTIRGQNAPLTQEVFEIKGPRYNPYWGWWKGKKRNSRQKKIALPQLYLNIIWDPQPNQNWELAIKAQKGQSSGSRLFYNGTKPEEGYHQGGGANPSPVYYQKLPSYFLRNAQQPNFEGAFWAEKKLQETGQLDWAELYEANKQHDWGTYALMEGIQENAQIAARLHYKRSLGNILSMNTYVYHAGTQLNYFGAPSTLFGAKYLWNTNGYAPTFETGFNDLNTKNSTIKIGDPFEYHYSMRVVENEIGFQLDYEKNRWTAFVAIKKEHRKYQRTGQFKNGAFPNTSYGKGALLHFHSKSIKSGLTYAPNGRHRISINTAYVEDAPTLRVAYLQPRLRDVPVPKIGVQQTKSLIANYHLSHPQIQLQLTAFGHYSKNAHQSRYYYADGIGGDQALFVQEVLSGIALQQLGVELGSELSITEVITFQGAMSVGNYHYDNNPNLILAATPTGADRTQNTSPGILDIGKANIQGYPIPSGPQKAFHLGFQYSDPKYWRFGIYGNYFTDNYINFNPLTRTANFYSDDDGHPFVEYEDQKGAALLRQEKLPSPFLMNLTFNKSWRIKTNYFGVFLSVQNLLNSTFKTGGFEQGRNANYRVLLQDQQRLKPLFAPKYWWGRGTSFFTSFYYRF